MINNIYDGSGERLFQIRKALGMTQIDFAKTLNSSNGHVSDMEKDRKNITDSTIELLKLKCNVNADWLRTGTGEMFVRTPSSTMEQLRREFNLDEFSFNLVYEYLKLGGEQRKAVRDFFYRVIEAEENVDYISEAPRTPEELEENFPPVEGADDSKTG